MILRFATDERLLGQIIEPRQFVKFSLSRRVNVFERHKTKVQLVIASPQNEKTSSKLSLTLLTLIEGLGGLTMTKHKKVKNKKKEQSDN